MYRRIVQFTFCIVLVVLPCSGRASAPPAQPEAKLSVRPSEPSPRAEKVRRMIGGLCSCGLSAIESYPALMEMGDTAFPEYELLLIDQQSNTKHVAGVLYILTRIKADRRRFIPHAVSRLRDLDTEVRLGAVELLAEIGGGSDSTPIIRLLSDEDLGVCHSAATALAKIGNMRELEAMDAWLKGGKHPNDGDYMIHVKKCRDELEKRLKENPIPKGIIN